MTIGTEEVQHRAYLIWEREGRPDGRALEHWVQAETELSQKNAEAVELSVSVPPEATTKKNSKI
jgi:hypothetical protein